MREKTSTSVVPEGFGNAVIGIRHRSVLEIDLRMESLNDGILVSGDVRGTGRRASASGCLFDGRPAVKVEFCRAFRVFFRRALTTRFTKIMSTLEPLVRDAVVLSLAVQPVCQEIASACAQSVGCGSLLDNPGHKHEDAIDPRWAALPDSRA